LLRCIIRFGKTPEDISWTFGEQLTPLLLDAWLEDQGVDGCFIALSLDGESLRRVL
jgi:hypothetical protein